jgi:antitoxin (DNA-binding transcriptional repressor) of toxin-antitoxin stability system
MSETMLTVEDAAACLGELVERVSARRETAVIMKAGRPVVRMVPVPTVRDVSQDLIAFLRRWQTEYPEPDEQLAEAIRESRQTVRSPQDPWD